MPRLANPSTNKLNPVRLKLNINKQQPKQEMPCNGKKKSMQEKPKVEGKDPKQTLDSKDAMGPICVSDCEGENAPKKRRSGTSRKVPDLDSAKARGGKSVQADPRRGRRVSTACESDADRRMPERPELIKNITGSNQMRACKGKFRSSRKLLRARRIKPIWKRPLRSGKSSKRVKLRSAREAPGQDASRMKAKESVQILPNISRGESNL